MIIVSELKDYGKVEICFGPTVISEIVFLIFLHQMSLFCSLVCTFGQKFTEIHIVQPFVTLGSLRWLKRA